MSYLYIAYASDDQGTGFTLTFDAGLDYVAILTSATEILTPVVTDFAGLWKNYKGAQGIQGPAGVAGAVGPKGDTGDPGTATSDDVANSSTVTGVSVTEALNTLKATIAALPQAVAQTQLEDLIRLQSSYINDRDLSAVTDILNRNINSITARQATVEDISTKTSAALNALILRFKRYASDAEILSAAAALSPTAEEKAALAGTNGTPSTLNKFVTNSDPRLVDSRNPNLHAATHAVGESDEISHTILKDIGTQTHAQLETTIGQISSDLGTAIADLGSTMTSVGNLQSWASGLTLDNLPLGTLYIQFTQAMADLIPSTDEKAALGNVLANSTNLFITSDEVSLNYQPVGTYLVPSDLQAVPGHLIPLTANTYDLGSPSKPWRAMYVGSQSLHIGGIHVTDDNGVLNINNKIVVTDANFNSFITADGRIDLAEAHYTTVHDWEFIRANTPGLVDVAASDLAALKTHNHDTRYKTVSGLSILAAAGSAPFDLFAKTADLTAGSIPVAWGSLTGIPDLASNKFKGVVNTYALLPTTGVVNNDVYITRASKNNSSLAGAYIVINAAGTTADDIYRSVFDASVLSHGGLGGLSSDDHSQYFNLSRLNTYMSSAGVVSSIKSNLGITSIGSGQIITDLERSKLNDAYVHSVRTGNPHNLTLAALGGIENSPAVIGATHLRTGAVSNAITTDSIPQGTTNKYATAGMFTAVTDLATHLADAIKHLTSTERTKLTGGGNCDLHYHSSDRLMSNIIGDLDAARISGLQSAVENLSLISLLVSKSHDEGHNISSHNDTDITGPQLDALFASHNYGTTSDGHNAQFAISGGANGVSTRIARQDHTHAQYALASALIALATSGTSQKVHWGNLIGIPQAVGDARNFANLPALEAATPTRVGEQVVVLDFDGDGHWAVYISISTNLNGWTQIATQTGGLAYAAVDHTHASYVLGTALNGLIDAEIAAYFALAGNTNKLVSSSDRTTWNGYGSSFNTHANNAVPHVSGTDRTHWDDSYTHSQTSDLHLGTGQKAILDSFAASVGGVSVTKNSQTKTIAEWIEFLSAGSSFSITQLTGWPATLAATTANLAKLFDGSNVTTHTHSAYATTSHTHVAANITDLDTFVEAYNYLDAAGVATLFSTDVLTTSDIHEGTNKYLSITNLRTLAAFNAIEDHTADNVTDRKHLSDGQRAALTGGVNSLTNLHSHAGQEYPVDDAVHIGQHRKSISDSTSVGTPGYVTAKGVIVTETTVPASTATSTGMTREIRFDDNYIYVKTSAGWKRSALSTF